MKRSLHFLLCLLCMQGLHAQITLNFTNNTPVPGDTLLVQTFDSSGVIPRNTGVNQTWDFSANLVPKGIKMYKYNAPAGYTSAPAGTTVVEEWDTMKVLYKSMTGSLEMLRL